jgi:hypothetical protein
LVVGAPKSIRVFEPETGLNNTAIGSQPQTYLNRIRQHEPNVVLVRFIDDRFLAQVSFLFRFFFRQDMVLERFFAFDLSGTCYFEPFLGS